MPFKKLSSYKKQIQAGIDRVMKLDNQLRKTYDKQLKPIARKRIQSIWKSVNKELRKLEKASTNWLKAKPKK